MPPASSIPPKAFGGQSVAAFTVAVAVCRAGYGSAVLFFFRFLCYAEIRSIILSEKDILLYKIDTLPAECLGEVIDFVEYIKRKQLKKIPETMFLSEASLAREWDTPEEDEAWRNL
jgi:hypothetical protein